MTVAELKNETIEYLDQERVSQSLERSRTESMSQNSLEQYAEEEHGLTVEEDQTFGASYTAAAEGAVQPPEERVGSAASVMGISRSDRHQKPVEEMQFNLEIQDLSGEEAGAIVKTSLSVGDTTYDYNCALVAKDDDPLQMKEFVFDGGEVVPAQSWWSRFVKCLGISWSELLSCYDGSVSGTIKCLAGKGLNAAKCAACATCNCHWTCRWGAGCCTD